MNENTKNVLKFQQSLKGIQQQFGSKAPDYTLVLGSGLDQIVNLFEIQKTISYAELAFFPTNNVQGHAGKLHLGKIHGKTVLIFAGRFHHYQGIANSIAALPSWISGFWKIPTLVTINAAGGISTSLQSGDIVLLRDHIFLQDDHPLNGVVLTEWENPFVDMTNVYDEGLRNKIIEAAKLNKISVHQGVYACMNGPSYETPSEINMLRILGADVVGMSTIPEVIVGRKMGMKVLGISIVANMAAGVGGKNETISHQEVLASVQKTQMTLDKLLSTWLKTS